MSTQALNAALSGLHAAQRGLDLVSTNISNADTEGYTRKILPQEALIAGEQGVGVKTGEVQRYVDRALQRDYRVQLGVDNYYNTRQDYLSRIVALQGSTDAQTNLGARIGALYNSFVTLSATPDSSVAQNSVVNIAKQTAASFNTLAASLQAMRNDVQQDIKTEVSNLNSSLQQLSDYNRRIGQLTAGGGSAATLEDQRDQLVKKISGQLDINYYVDGNDMLVLQTKSGHILVDSDPRTLMVPDQAALNVTNTYPATLGGIIIQDKDGTGYDLASASPGGKIGALLELRDKDIPAYSAELDELAHTMMVRFNDQGLKLFTDDQGNIPVNDPTVYAGLASRLRVNADVIANPALLQSGTAGGTVNPGSADKIQDVLTYTFGRYKDAAGTLNQAFKFSGNGYNQDIDIGILGDPNATLSDFANAMLDDKAQSFNAAKSDYETEHQYMQEVEKRLTDGSAVNTDEEMAHMIELQKSYAASAKMVNALDELFKDLLNAF